MRCNGMSDVVVVVVVLTVMHDNDAHGDSVVSVDAGSDGGALMAAGMSANSSVIILENANNGIDMKDEKAVC